MSADRARAYLTAFSQQIKTADELLRVMESGDFENTSGESRDEQRRRYAGLGMAILTASTFFCSREIMDVLMTIRSPLPSDWRPDQSLVPTLSGFISLEQPLVMQGAALYAIAWLPWHFAPGKRNTMTVLPTSGDVLKDSTGLSILFFQRVGESYGLMSLGVWAWSDTMEQAVALLTEDVSGEHPEVNAAHLLQFFATFCLFIRQRIFVAGPMWPDRASVRRMQRREKDAPLPPVHVVQLRRRVTPIHEGEERSSVDWSCQWMVRGHWRQQWYPSLHRNQPIWIMPYVKGPEDKPLRTPRPTIFAAVR